MENLPQSEAPSESQTTPWDQLAETVPAPTGIESNIITEETIAAPAEKLDSKQSDRLMVDKTINTLGAVLNQEGLEAESQRELNLQLDVMDTLASELDDEDNQQGAYELLQKLAERYDKLYQKAPTEERKHKYSDMATYARAQMPSFEDKTAKSAQPQTAATATFQELANLA